MSNEQFMTSEELMKSRGWKDMSHYRRRIASEKPELMGDQDSCRVIASVHREANDGGGYREWDAIIYCFAFYNCSGDVSFCDCEVWDDCNQCYMLIDESDINWWAYCYIPEEEQV